MSPEPNTPTDLLAALATKTTLQLSDRLETTTDALADVARLLSAELKREDHRLASAARQLAQWSTDAKRDASRLRRRLT